MVVSLNIQFKTGCLGFQVVVFGCGVGIILMGALAMAPGESLAEKKGRGALEGFWAVPLTHAG